MKKALAFILSAAMILSLSSCGKKSEKSALAGTYDIKVWVADGITDLTKQQIEDFNKTNTDGITFNPTIQPVDEGTIATQIVTDVQAAGDIFIFSQDQLGRLVQAGALAKLGQQAAQTVKDNNTPESVTAVTLNNELYAYPITADNGYFMYYDKSVIPESDIDSMEKLIEDCENANKYFCMEVDTNGWYIASFFFGTGCTSEWTIDDSGKAIGLTDTFNSPEGLVACKGMKKLLDSKAHVNSSSASEFDSGAAVLVCGTWAYDDIKAILGDNLGATDMPSFNVDGKDYHMGSFCGFKMMGVKPQTDANKQAALHKLAQYLSGEKCQLERFQARSWGPSNTVAQKDPAVSANAGQIAINLQAPYATPQSQTAGEWWDIVKVIGSEVKEASDDADMQKALSNYEEKCKALIA